MEKWKCPKCGNEEYEKEQFQATGGNFAKIFDVQNKKFEETVKNRDKNMVDLICREKCLLLWKSTEAVAVSIIRGD